MAIAMISSHCIVLIVTVNGHLEPLVELQRFRNSFFELSLYILAQNSICTTSQTI